jgi:hypothetical protein
LEPSMLRLPPFASRLLDVTVAVLIFSALT